MNATYTPSRLTARRAVAGARRRAATAVAALLLTGWWSATASAQLDPLLFVRRVQPTVIIVVDTSLRMLEDGTGNFYDPNFYSTTADPAVMSAFSNINSLSTATYRRIYQNLQYSSSPDRYIASRIVATAAVWDPASALTSNAPADKAFLDPTRYNITRQGIAAAVSENAGSSFRWGLIRLRQSTPAWRNSPNCDRPVVVTDAWQAALRDSSPCNGGGSGRYGIYAPSVLAASYDQVTAPAGTVMVSPAANTASAITSIVNRGPNDPLALIPAGLGDVGIDDRPLSYALADARAAAITAMAADTVTNRSCRNTVVVLITSGKDDGSAAYKSANDAAAVASTFQSVTGGGVTKPVPVHVVAVKPAAADEASLQAIATNSRGVYRNATSASDIAAAINYAVQSGFRRAEEFNTFTTSEFLPVSPVVGTVNLVNARSASGSVLPNTDITSNPGNQPLKQRSNVLLSAGFSLPGFDGVLRAFRTYVPETDATAPTGWKFVKDGTKLWPDLDGRPALAGAARVPADPSTRNIYTFIPNGSGGGSVVAFTTANLAALAPHLNAGSNPADLITTVRAQPLGAIIGSTPALMDAPSLDPPPDDDYGRSDASSSFAGQFKDRRSMIFFGANDGMIHAVDARTGYEVWAFIPYNLLPKLRTLLDGQSMEQFDYFVDSSPKIAEVKLGGSWRSLLIIGQGQGGTFYQTFDVTNAGMGVSPESDDISAVTAMLGRFDAPGESIQFKWSFPNYSSFDPTYTGTFTVSDGTPGSRVKVFGDLRSSATYAEKTVGYSWSDPAVGALNTTRSINAVIVGSGYFPAIESLLPGRGPTAPSAGNAMYLLNADTGELIGNPSGGSCPTISSGSGSGVGCVVVDDVAANGRKNALQADPTAAGANGTYTVSKAYIGDIDGRYWRFTFSDTGSLSVNLMADTGAPIYASSALLFVGSADIYMFFATGSDLLPSNAPGGTGIFRLYGLKDNGTSALTKFARDLATVTNTNGLATGERPSTAPSVAGDIVFYTTTTESAATPCADFSAKLYGLTYAGGAAYDSNNNGTIDNNESPVVSTLAGRATSPFIVDQHLYFGTAGSTGANIEAFGDPEDFNNGIGQVGVRILSWREIR